jgi:ornithine cyclodeaminase
MIVLDDAAVLELVGPAELVPAMRQAFLQPSFTPARFHGDLPGGDEAKLLIMPSWLGRDALGVKVVTVNPANVANGRPTVDGVYLLMNGQTGQTLAVMSARALTALRTAAVCALAASILSRRDSKVLLMMGTGVLVPHLISAYLSVRSLERVVLWGRDAAKASALAEKLSTLPVELCVATDLTAALGAVDIISSATLARSPLINGRRVAPGTHVDLVGSFTPQMREADSELFQRGRVFVDAGSALHESGDLIGPIADGLISASIPDLTDLLRDPSIGRSEEGQITIFKSVGTGLADLAAARYVFERQRVKASCAKL